MPQISKQTTGTDTMSASSSFKPTILEDLSSHIAAISEGRMLVAPTESKVQAFRQAVRNGSLIAAVEAFSYVYDDDDMAAKTLLEAAIDIVDISNVDLVNFVCVCVPEHLSPLITVLVIRDLCNTEPKNARDYVDRYFLPGTVNDIIEGSEGKFPPYYTKLEYCSNKYWSYPLHIRDKGPKDSYAIHQTDKETVEDIKLASLLSND